MVLFYILNTPASLLWRIRTKSLDFGRKLAKIRWGLIHSAHKMSTPSVILAHSLDNLDAVGEGGATLACRGREWRDPIQATVYGNSVTILYSPFLSLSLTYAYSRNLVVFFTSYQSSSGIFYRSMLPLYTVHKSSMIIFTSKYNKILLPSCLWLKSCNRILLLRSLYIHTVFINIVSKKRKLFIPVRRSPFLD